MIISIDGGTTNTRLTLVREGKVYDRIKISVGARDKENSLSELLKRNIAELLEKNNILSSEVKAITASGMITSDAGLKCVPHISTPAGAQGLKSNAVKTVLPEISDIPFYFIPGVKAVGKTALDTDIMRGEETEIIGILSVDIKPPFTALMPGSHSKIVNVNRQGEIESFCTCMSGELTRAAAENTILSRSLNGAFTRNADEDYLVMGFNYSREHGVNRAMFKVRVLDLFGDGISPEQLYSFLLGAVLQNDVDTALKTGTEKIVIAGSDPFRSAYKKLFESCGKQVIVLDEDVSENLAAIGAAAVIG